MCTIYILRSSINVFVLLKAFSLKYESEDIDVNVLDTDSNMYDDVTGKKTKAFNHNADNELLFFFLNISVSVDRACPSLNKTPA